MCEIPPVVYAVEADRHGVKEIELPFFLSQSDAQSIADEKNAQPNSWPRRVVAVDVK